MWSLFVSLVWAQAVDFECGPVDASGQVRGVPPVMVTCEAQVDALFDYSEAEWLMGDGTVLRGDTVEHVYDETGQFDVRLTLADFGYSLDTGTVAAEDTVVKRGHVTVCAEPVAEFSYVFKGGLSYQMINTSTFVPDCLGQLQWTVYEGEGRGGPVVLEAAGWEPRLTVPEEGTYTFVLDLAGIAGSSAAKITVQAEGGLSDDYDNKSQACSQAPSLLAVASTGWLVPLAVLLRRRDRETARG